MITHRRTRVLAALLTCLAVVTPAGAKGSKGTPTQVDDLAQLSLADLLEVTVVTASRHEESANSAPASVSVITAEQIATFGWRTLAEALRSVPGMHVTDDRNYVAIGARGVSVPGDFSNRVIVLVDGHRVNDKVYHSPDAQEFLPVAMDAVERIEIVRGPGSVLYGSDALLAVINVITRDGSGSPTSSLRAGLGTQQSWELGGGHEGQHGPWSISTQVQVTGSAGDSSVTSPVVGTVKDADALSAVQLYARASRGQFTLSAGAASRQKEVPTASYGTLPIRGTRTVDERSFLEARWTRAIGRGTLVTRAALDRAEYSGTYIYDYSEAGDGSLPLPWRDASSSTSLRFDVNHDLPLGKRVRLMLGGDYEDVFQANQKYWDALTGEVADFPATERSWGLHSSAELNLSTWATLVLGGRFSDSSTGSGSATRLALVLKPWRRTSLKLLRSTAFRDPSLYETSYYAANISGLRAPPQRESLTTHELAFTRALPHGLEFGLSAYHTTLANIIRLQSDPEGIYFKNDDSVTSRGLEWSLDGAWRPGWRMQLNGLVQKSESEQGEPIPNSPEMTLNASLVAPLGRGGRSTLAVETHWISGRHTLAAKSTGSSLVTSLQYRRLELAGVKGLELTVRATNATDEVAWVPGGAEHSQDLLPSAHRRVMVGLHWQF